MPRSPNRIGHRRTAPNHLATTVRQAFTTPYHRFANTLEPFPTLNMTAPKVSHVHASDDVDARELLVHEPAGPHRDRSSLL